MTYIVAAHPFLGVQPLVNGGVTANCLRYPPNAPRNRTDWTITPALERLQADDRVYGSMREAEEAVMREVEPFAYAARDLSQDENNIAVNRASNMIYCRTRVGWGDRIMLHWYDLPLLPAGKGSLFHPYSHGAPSPDGWRFAGIISNTIEVWTTMELPAPLTRGQAIVAHHGQGETLCGAFIAVRSDETFSVAIRRPEPDVLGSLRDYMTIITLADERRNSLAA